MGFSGELHLINDADNVRLTLSAQSISNSNNMNTLQNFQSSSFSGSQPLTKEIHSFIAANIFLLSSLENTGISIFSINASASMEPIASACKNLKDCCALFEI